MSEITAQKGRGRGKKAAALPVDEEMEVEVTTKKAPMKRKNAKDENNVDNVADKVPSPAKKPVEPVVRGTRTRKPVNYADTPEIESVKPKSPSKATAASKKQMTAEVKKDTKKTAAAKPEKKPSTTKGRGKKAKSPSPDDHVEVFSNGKKTEEHEDVEEEDPLKGVDGEEDAEMEVVKPKKGAAAESKAKKGRSGKAAAANKADAELPAAVEKPAPAKKRGRAAAPKASNDDIDSVSEPKKVPAKSRGRAKKPIPTDEIVNGVSSDEPKPKKTAGKRKAAVPGGKSTATENEPDGSGPSAPKMNKTTTDYGNFTRDLPSGREWNFKISSWNVAGIRAWLNKGGLTYIEQEKPDVICFQETKCVEEDMPDTAQITGYLPYYLCKTKGYAGVAIYSKKMPMNVQYGVGNAEQDKDGRLLTAEYEKFYVVCAYVPNAGRKLVTLDQRLRWNELFLKYIRRLDEKKPVILCGDLNVAHNEIDLKNPKTNKKTAGFTQEERDGMTDLLNAGFVDTFRHLYPKQIDAYTFWSFMGNARAKNVGWRLDYFIVSQRLMKNVIDNVIRSEVYGSDHCPIALFLKL